MQVMYEGGMAYQDPTQVRSPKGAVTHLHVIYDGGEQTMEFQWEGWSVAELEWYENPVLAIRWNGSTSREGVSEVGNPQSRGNPTWFIVPKPLHEAIKTELKNAPPRQRDEALTQGFAEGSGPAFAAVWNNPEDDVYDAL
jgi:hypothetical protein